MLNLALTHRLGATMSGREKKSVSGNKNEETKIIGSLSKNVFFFFFNNRSTTKTNLK